MARSHDYDHEDKCIRIVDHAVEFHTVETHYNIKCPGCSFVKKLENLEQQSSTEVQILLCKECHGYFLLTKKRKLNGLMMRLTYSRNSSENSAKKSIRIPSTKITNWGSSENIEVKRFLLSNRFDVKRKTLKDCSEEVFEVNLVVGSSKN